MQKAFAINYFGIFFAAKYKIAAMLKNGGGSVVNISSDCGLRGEYSVAAYTATKHAICGFSKCAALELCPGKHPRQLRLPRRDEPPPCLP